MKASRTGLVLAVAATLFAGVFIGLGNMIHLSVSGDDDGPGQGHHAHHAHQASGEAEPDVLAAILTMPEHCLFCIDGVAPQPVALIEPLPLRAQRAPVPAPAAEVRAVAAAGWRIHYCREPPALRV